MEFKVIFWVVVGIIWFITQLWKKTKEAAPKESVPPAVPPSPKTPGSPATSGQNRQVSVSQPKRDIISKPKPVYTKIPLYKSEKKKSPLVSQNSKEQPVKRYNEVDYDNNIEDEEIVAMRQLKADQFAAQLQKRHGMGESPAHFAPYEEKETNYSKIYDMLKNPDDIKNALIIAEIMKPKFE